MEKTGLTKEPLYNREDMGSFSEANQILIGLELLYPQEKMIYLIRKAFRTLSIDRTDEKKVLLDLFDILNLLEEEKINEIKNSTTNVEPFLRDIALQGNLFFKIKKIMDFYFNLYQNTLLLSLKKAYEHFFSFESELQALNFLTEYTDKNLIHQIKIARETIKEFPIEKSFAKGQILSKIWAKEVLDKQKDLNPQSLLLLCGWTGLLSYILLEDNERVCVSVDKDDNCTPLASRTNRQYQAAGRFHAITKDIFDINYDKVNLSPYRRNQSITIDRFDLIINTSCEHIPNFKQWYDSIPDGQLLLLQSNDFFECDEHVNCVNSTEEFRDQTPMSKRLFSGALPLEKYTRYMVLGYK